MFVGACVVFEDSIVAHNTPPSLAVDLDDVIQVFPMRTATKQTDAGTVKVVAAKPTNMSLKAILMPYAVSQFVSALVGGFGKLLDMV